MICWYSLVESVFSSTISWKKDNCVCSACSCMVSFCSVIVCFSSNCCIIVVARSIKLSGISAIFVTLIQYLSFAFSFYSFYYNIILSSLSHSSFFFVYH